MDILTILSYTGLLGGIITCIMFTVYCITQHDMYWYATVFAIIPFLLFQLRYLWYWCEIRNQPFQYPRTINAKYADSLLNTSAVMGHVGGASTSIVVSLVEIMFPGLVPWYILLCSGLIASTCTFRLAYISKSSVSSRITLGIGGVFWILLLILWMSIFRLWLLCSGG
jgi:hypothetical protein